MKTIVPLLFVLSIHLPAAYSQHFVYDPADHDLAATLPASPNAYDAAPLAVENGLWMTWLEYVPGEGDRLVVGFFEGNALKRRIEPGKPGRYARPTLTRGGKGNLWLTVEKAVGEERTWKILAFRYDGEKAFEEPVALLEKGINHDTAPDSRGGVWIAWQSVQDGRFVIRLALVKHDLVTELEGSGIVSHPDQNAWRPSVAPGPRGMPTVFWDAYDGESFNVCYRSMDHGGELRRFANTPAFEARPDAAQDSKGRIWVAWEEGGENWGKPYREKPGGWNNSTDASGPLHRFRKIRLACILPGGEVVEPAAPLPQPGLDAAAARTNRWPGVTRTGAFYERPRLAVDAQDRVWIAYGHFYRPQLGSEKSLKHHIERGWRVYLRCLDGEAWQDLYGGDVYLRTGLDRLSLAPRGNGVAAAWTTGRTDRRKDPHPVGVGFVCVDGAPGEASRVGTKVLVSGPDKPSPASRERPASTVGGAAYQLAFGDLHRHTDLSLCFPYFDGSIEDAYRYAIDVGGLDFLGITDHTRDIAHGDVASLLWWRCVKEADRHRLGGRFIPYYAYERSHGATDHNVVSLRDDMIRNFPPPLPEFWKELKGDTFTIPHAPVNQKCWNYQDDALRPLMEIYQGCRNYDSLAGARAGLDKGYKFGFIASSDHLSTSASYAGVWSPSFSPEPLFRSMQARRTFGATAPVELVFRSGGRWMGEAFTSEEVPEFQIFIKGTAPLSEVLFHKEQEVLNRWTFDGDTLGLETAYTPTAYLNGTHYFYITLAQADGNEAWSSPIWVTYDNPNPRPEPPPPEPVGDRENLALGKPVTIGFPQKPTAGTPTLVTDGKLDKHLGHGSLGPAWAQVDLGELRELAGVKIWHYYRDGRTYVGNRVAVSVTGAFEGEEDEVFDSEVSGGYVETSEGRMFSFEPVKARYVRNWLTDNTRNRTCQWVEIEAYGPSEKVRKADFRRLRG